jgi:hypothetical protein
MLINPVLGGLFRPGRGIFGGVMKAEVIVNKDDIRFITRTNGDKLKIENIHFDADDASNLALMINSGNKLKLVIKTIQEGE